MGDGRSPSPGSVEIKSEEFYFISRTNILFKTKKMFFIEIFEITDNNLKI